MWHVFISHVSIRGSNLINHRIRDEHHLIEERGMINCNTTAPLLIYLHSSSKSRRSRGGFSCEIYSNNNILLHLNFLLALFINLIMIIIICQMLDPSCCSFALSSHEQVSELLKGPFVLKMNRILPSSSTHLHPKHAAAPVQPRMMYFGNKFMSTC